jgi:serine/threonine protein kinase
VDSGEPRPLGSRYLRIAEIGRGGLASVWIGRVISSGEEVAIKLLNPSFSRDQGLVARFISEGSILKGLESRHLVKIRDLVVDGDMLAIVMELVRGGDLRSYLRRLVRLPPAVAVDLTIQVLDALVTLHTAGIVHRDIKPENVLLELALEPPVAKLTDFGIAQIIGDVSDAEGTVVGSLPYIAPEVFRSSSVTEKIDIYSVGVLLYELLAGRVPFVGESVSAMLYTALNELPPPLPLPPPLWSVLTTLLDRTPAVRPTAREALGILESLRPILVELPPLQTDALPTELARAVHLTFDTEITRVISRARLASQVPTVERHVERRNRAQLFTPAAAAIVSVGVGVLSTAFATLTAKGAALALLILGGAVAVSGVLLGILLFGSLRSHKIDGHKIDKEDAGFVVDAVIGVSHAIFDDYEREDRQSGQRLLEGPATGRG